MTTTDLHPAAIAAADWWAEQIGAPTFRATDHRDSPESRDAMGFAGMLQTLLVERTPVTEDASKKFVELLARQITTWIEQDRRWITLGVDYGPDRELAAPAEAAGISTSRFPWKTTMWVKADHVTAALGYGAQAVLVWAAEDWARPACGSLEYDEVTHRFGDQRCGRPKYHHEGHGDWVADDRRCSGCGLTEGGHHNRRDTGDAFHPFEVAAVEA